MTALARVEKSISEASDGVAAAKTLIAQGQAVDLAGLETHIALLCDDISNLPPSERAPLKQRLIGLIDDLGSLADSVAAFHEKLSADLKQRSAGNQASSAYGGARKK